MFEKLRARSRKHRRRKSMRLRKGRGPRSASRLRASGVMPILKIAGLAVAGAGLVLLIIFVIVPLVFGDGGTQDTTVEATATPIPSPTPIANENMAENVDELLIDAKAINDAYIYSNEVVFSTGGVENIDTIAVYDIETGETTEIETITKKYDNIFEPKINDNFIVYLDCKNEYGGAVCGYDRSSDEMFVMREYKYGKPKVTLSGDYALWLQQTNEYRDKLYLCHIPTLEFVEIEYFKNPQIPISAAHMSNDAIVFVQPQGESQVLDGSSASMEYEICVMPLEQEGDAKRMLFLPGMFVYKPMIDGDNIIFMDNTGDETSRLMLCTKTGEAYSAPEVIAEGILNYDIGDGYVVYTKNEAVHIYYFADGSSGMLSSETTRAMLACANGKDVVWYDITGGIGDTVDIIMHIEVP